MKLISVQKGLYSIWRVGLLVNPDSERRASSTLKNFSDDEATVDYESTGETPELGGLRCGV